MSPLSGCLLKRIALFVLWSAVLICFAAIATQAQTVSVSPGDLSFAVPTGTAGTPPASSPDTVTVSIAGASPSSPVSFSSISVSGEFSSDFVIEGTSCSATFTAPGSCTVTMHFTASQAPASTLETGTLVIVSSAGTLKVPVNGAFGAIKLFSALNIGNSLFPGVTWPNSPGNPVKTVTLNISCPAQPTAILSSTPDGSGNVFQDNTIQVSDTPFDEKTITTSNVCYGGDPNFEGFTGFPAGTSNCFQSAYEGAAAGFFGQNPDLAQGLIANYGVQPLNLMNAAPIESSPLYPAVLVSGMQTIQVQLVDAGGFNGAATLHLATNCTPTGLTPPSTGITQSGNPITATTDVQTFPFITVPGKLASFTTNDSTDVTVAQVVPVVTLFGLSQSFFASLVNGTASGPAVCLRLSGVFDSTGANECAAFQLVCFNPADGTTSGNNCGTSTARTLIDSAHFDSLDMPTFATELSDACAHYLTTLTPPIANGTCASSLGSPSNPSQLIGPAFLMFGDSLTGPVCPLSAPFSPTGPCPFDELVAFAGDPLPTGGSAPTRNTLLVPAANKPKPFAQGSIDGHPDGWTNSGAVQGDFTAFAATYSPTTTNPPANGFTALAPYSLTWGITPASVPVPDTTLPVAGDTPIFNTATNGGFLNPPPFCNVDGTTPSPFKTNTGLIAGLADGLYNLHFFVTDCGLSEGLLFNPTSDPTANWANFQVLPFGVDSMGPSISATYPGGQTFTVNQAASVQYSCTDDRSGLGNCAGPLPQSCPSAPTPGPLSYTFSAPLNTAPAAIGPQSFQVTAQDCAGNTSAPVTVSYTVTAPSADVGLFEQETSDHVRPGGNLTFVVWALDLGKATSYNVSIAESVPAGVLGGAISAQTAIVSCTLANGCSALTGGTSCATNSGLVQCAIGTLPSVLSLKGAVVKITVPIAKSVPPGTVFKVNAVVSSANDPNPRNNSVIDTVTVTSN